MGQNIFICASLIFFQSIIENWFEGRRRCGSRVSVGHESEGRIVGEGDREELHRLAKSGHPVIANERADKHCNVGDTKGRANSSWPGR